MKSIILKILSCFGSKDYTLNNLLNLLQKNFNYQNVESCFSLFKLLCSYIEFEDGINDHEFDQFKILNVLLMTKKNWSHLVTILMPLEKNFLLQNHF